MSSFVGSRPESSEGEQPSSSQQQSQLMLLDPLAINLMPPELEHPTDDAGNAGVSPDAPDLRRPHHHLKEDEVESGFAPKGSLV